MDFIRFPVSRCEISDEDTIATDLE